MCTFDGWQRNASKRKRDKVRDGERALEGREKRMQWERRLAKGQRDAGRVKRMCKRRVNDIT